jgi:hypothetical protein
MARRPAPRVTARRAVAAAATSMPAPTAPPARNRGCERRRLGRSRRSCLAPVARGLARADADIGAGRAELTRALARFEAAGVAAGRLLAGAALEQCIGIADDDYAASRRRSRRSMPAATRSTG